MNKQEKDKILVYTSDRVWKELNLGNLQLREIKPSTTPRMPLGGPRKAAGAFL